MICDLRSRPQSQSIEVDLCIIGAGAAGIAMAREFSGSQLRVALLESGGYNFDVQVQALYQGESVGEPYINLAECRTRRFGGSTNCWGGMCTPLTAIDFRKRPWVPYSGWPISEHELQPYMQRAHQLCGIGPYGYDENVWQDVGADALPFDPDLFWSHFWQINNRRGNRQVRFAQKFHTDLRNATNVQVYLHANVSSIVLDRNKRRVASARTKTMDGREHQIFAKTFVLACGGIENVRLLLASNKQQPDGIGNDYDVVGRFFNDHLHAPCASVAVEGGTGKLVNYSRMWRLGKSIALPGLTLSPHAQEKYQTLNASLSIDAVFESDYLWTAIKKLRDDIQARKVSRKMLNNIIRAARKSRTLVPDIYGRMLYGTRPTPVDDPKTCTLYARAEQAPIPESRIRLGQETDKLGMRKVVLDWRTSEIDHRAFAALVTIAKAEFKRLDLGIVHEHEWVRDQGWPDTLSTGPHHMGATRMADNPRLGVVDRNAKVHGIDSLYIAGSSVFPTGGHANCTLTLLATTLRLCDHLKWVLSAVNQPASFGLIAQAV